MKNPNIQNDPPTIETVERVKLAAQNILNTAGAQSYDGSMESAVVAIEYSALTEHPEKVLPTILVNKALGEFALKARWDYEITVGAQDPHASRHALFMKDVSIDPEISFYDDREDWTMSELEALAIAMDLERAAISESSQQ